MCTIGTSSRRKRGTSTVLGTLIFIGILFTAVIPMFLAMKQADTFYDKRKLELMRLDEERRSEDLHVYVYPTPDQPPEPPSLTVSVENKGEFIIKVVRIWINDIYYEIDSAVQSLSMMNLGSYEVSPQDGSYFVKVTTDRGNVFASDTGVLYYGDGRWEAEIMIINVLISVPGTIFKIEVSGLVDEVPPSYFEEAMVQKVGEGSAFKAFKVSTAGTYSVKVTRGSNVIYNDSVTIEWTWGTNPDEAPVVWVYVV